MMKTLLRSCMLATLVLLAACSSGLQQDPPSLDLNTLNSTTTLRLPIITTSDDAEEVTGGSVSFTGGLLDLRAKKGVLQSVGLRFQKATIPPGATITSAHLEVKGGGAYTGPVTLSVRGEASDHAATFGTGRYNLSSRSKTSAALTWTPTSWVQGGSYRTGNLGPVVQEIVRRPGWKSGNALALVIDGSSGTSERAAIAYGGKPEHVPVLVVSYEVSASAPAPQPAPTPDPTPSTPVSSGTLTFKSAAGADDAEQTASGSLRSGTSAQTLNFSVEAGVAQSVGLRFTNLPIPQGSKITAATLSLTASAADAGVLSLQIRGEAADHAAAFGLFAGRPQTTAAAIWKPRDWSAGAAVRTPDLSAVVQEVINRNGWKNGNALALIVTGDGKVARRAHARDAGEAKAPVLSVTFEPPQAAPAPAPQPTPAPEPTPEPAPAPAPEPAPAPQPLPPSTDLATWHSRTLQTIKSPNYISALDPKRMAASGDLYVYGRNYLNYVTTMILAYRETGDRDIVRHLDEIMNIAKDQLGDFNSDGFRSWLYLKEDGDYTTKPYVGTDLIALDEILAHSMVAAAAYTFKEAGFESSAAFWTDYLKNDFEAKWRERNSKPTGFPFVNHKLMHPTTNFIRYHLYMHKLTGERSYYSEAVRLTAAVKGTMRSSGDGYVWDHEVGRQSGCQPMVYVRYTTQAMVDIATVDSSLFSSSFMRQVANTMASKALINSTGTPLANDICGGGTYGNTNAFFNFPYAQLAPWDSSGKLKSAAERVYAALERNASSPVNANIPATMVFTLGR